MPPDAPNLLSQVDHGELVYRVKSDMTATVWMSARFGGPCGSKLKTRLFGVSPEKIIRCQEAQVATFEGFFYVCRMGGLFWIERSHFSHIARSRRLKPIPLFARTPRGHAQSTDAPTVVAFPMTRKCSL